MNNLPSYGKDSNDISSTTDIGPLDSLSAHDVLLHFNAHIYPAIKATYFPPSSESNRALLKLFTSQQKQKSSENDAYKKLGVAVTKGIFDFIIGDDTKDIRKLNLFLEVMYLEMTTTAYANSWLDFNNCAKEFGINGEIEKMEIIVQSLKRCDQQFRKGVTVIHFTKDNLIFENGYGTTIQSRKDFLGKDSQGNL